MKNFTGALLLVLLVGMTANAKVTVHLDVTETPQLSEWGNKAKSLMEEWYPRVINMIPTKGFEAPSELWLKIEKKEDGVAAASQDHIVVSSGWIEKHPEDIGCVFHEMVHVIQNYKGNSPGWLTEGIADYLRWAIFEGKNQDYFRVPQKEKGYRDSYQVAAGFLLWLETGVCPGIVNSLNTAIRKQEYKGAEFFEKIAGKSLDTLWDEYRLDRKKP